MRRGVKFHNGAALTAQDVVYTFNRLLDPKFGSGFRSVLGFVKSVEAQGDHTVRFQLSTPNAELPFLLGSPQAGIVPDQAKARGVWRVQPVGAGPFPKLWSLSLATASKMARYPDYWDAEQIKVQELHSSVSSSFSAQATALVNGEIDLVPDISFQTYPRWRTILKLSWSSAQWSLSDSRHAGHRATLHSTACARPLKYCVDRPALQQAVLKAVANWAMTSLSAPVSPFWANLPLRSRNLARPRQLLAAAGYANGLQLSLITYSFDRHGRIGDCVS